MYATLHTETAIGHTVIRGQCFSRLLNVYDLNDRFVSYAFGDAKIRQNVFVNGQLTFSMNLEKILNIRDNLTLNHAQTIFTDYSGGDYSIPENSSVYHSLPGFKACDYANVGRYITE